MQLIAPLQSIHLNDRLSLSPLHPRVIDHLGHRYSLVHVRLEHSGLQIFHLLAQIFLDVRPPFVGLRALLSEHRFQVLEVKRKFVVQHCEQYDACCPDIGQEAVVRFALDDLRRIVPGGDFSNFSSRK